MKLNLICILFGVLSIVALILATHSALASTEQVSIAAGAGLSGQNRPCVLANNCFDPKTLNVSPGDTVSWTNLDSVLHTVTSGHPNDSQPGTLFDKTIPPGYVDSVTFQDPGTFYYFCTIHPWLTGKVIVGAGTSGGVNLGNMGISSVGNHPLMTMIEGTVSDGSTKVIISYSPSPPTSGQPMSIALTFLDSNGNLIKHQNYAISTTQDGNNIFSNSIGHTHTGNDVQTTNNLSSSNSVDIQITLNGVGLPGTDPSTWTGPKGAVLNFHVVPEFGPFVSIILVIAIISGIVVSSKARFLKL